MKRSNDKQKIITGSELLFKDLKETDLYSDFSSARSEGNLITILDNASELVILSIGMTLVTAASGGQDISVGATIALAGSVVLRILCGTDTLTDHIHAPIIVAFLACVLVAMLFGAFNGVLVAYFKLQPMVATLILFTAGRSIAAWINNNTLPNNTDPRVGYYGNFFPGIAVPSPSGW